MRIPIMLLYLYIVWTVNLCMAIFCTSGINFIKKKCKKFDFSLPNIDSNFLIFQQTKAASVPAKKSSSRQQQKQHQQKVPLHPNYHSQRRLSLGETFTVQTFEEHSKYPILPPLTAKSSDIEIDDDESRYNIDHRVQNIIQNVNQRTLGKEYKKKRNKP